MSTHGNQTRRGAAGFTLIEMLVVLSILALVASLSMPLLSRGSEGVRLDTAASDLSAALNATRAAAIAANRPMALMVDVERQEASDRARFRRGRLLPTSRPN